MMETGPVSTFIPKNRGTSCPGALPTAKLISVSQRENAFVC